MSAKSDRKLTFLQAIAEAVTSEMRRDPLVFTMGQDIRSGVYGDFQIEEFGERVRNLPISEGANAGAAVGAALAGMRPVLDFSISTFLYSGMDQVVNQAAKARYLFGGQAKVPVVIRAALFYGASQAAHHTDRPWPMFMNVPGLKIITPSTPYDVKGLLIAAIREDDPVMCFEDATLWGTRGVVPEESYAIPLGKADVKREGDDVTVVAISGAVRHALTAAAELAKEGVSVEVVDPRSLVPMDWDTIFASVDKTRRLVVADPAVRTCSAASEIAATVSEERFSSLLAPVRRVTVTDVHIPFSHVLEREVLVKPADIVAGVRRVLEPVAVH
jgi:acetoin:2,6-dichlorophenolindophenol oxidoreductase subunit beta